MIDVQPYIDKLELLKEYMAKRIDAIGEYGWTDIGWLPIMTASKVVQLYHETGILYWIDPKTEPMVREHSFDEWLKNKKQ